MLHRFECQVRLLATFVVGVAIFPLLAGPASAQEIPADHQRPLLTPWEEAAWLQQLVEQSPHRQALEAAIKAGAPVPAGPVVQGPVGKLAPPPPPAAWPKKKGRKLLGYLPYWTTKTALLPWKTLTQLAWFSAGLSSAGAITTNAGWGGAEAKAMIAKAHSNDVQVVLTITQFTTATISQILATPASRTKAVNSIVAEVIAGGGDGVNIDFEGLAKADRDEMKAFIAELTTTMHAKLPGSDVTLATPCVDWSGAWDYQYLAEHSDGLMVMAYAIHWGGGSPGPQLPMAKLAPWTHKTLQWVVDDYVLYAKVQNKPKIMIGLPLYGYRWLSTTNKPGAAQLEKGTSIFYDAAQVEAPKQGGFLWDKASESSWYVKPSGSNWIQTWCDNFKAFQMRVDYVHTSDVMMGLWALGYANNHPEVWNAIEAWQDKGLPPKPVDAGADAGADAGKDAATAPDSAKETIAETAADVGDDAGPPDVAKEDAGQDAAPETAPDAPPADVAAVEAGEPAADPTDGGQPDATTADLTQSDVPAADTSAADVAAPDPAGAEAGPVDAVGAEVAAPDATPPKPDTTEVAQAADLATQPNPADAGAGPAGEVTAADATGTAGPAVAAVAPGAASGCNAARPTTAPWAPWTMALAAGVALALRRRRV